MWLNGTQDQKYNDTRLKKLVLISQGIIVLFMQKGKVTYRLYPSKFQEEKLEATLLVHQKLYNRALEQKINTHKGNHTYSSFYEQCKYLTTWRSSDKSLAAVNAQLEQVT